ncbi:Panacea domain-containing protein [Megasphaera sp. DISK 18]|uniref:Panacea domain-containing protein n=1 Tax=Megasphaera sp. DISK 18 TaxID=1776081 RepID=UPI000A8A87C5|nr:type II toxin-antitoxin system antitoxin SocA domain-containing protein [Megasphaera sp. DISK 18]
MVRAIDVARFFINITNTIPTDDLMTNMRVNKLLYFAQGECLRQLGEPLFCDEMEAWNYGPVVPCVYQTYKIFGREPIKDETEYQDNLSDQEKDVLFDVLRYYGQFSTNTLVSMSHQKQSPWAVVHKDGVMHTKISKEAIKSFFESKDPIPKFTLPYQESDFVGYRDKDGYLVLPKDWDDEE